jgi:hypothetical protein
MFNPIGPRGVRALVAAPFLAGLASLNLQGAKVGVTGTRTLAATPALAGLCELCLPLNGIGNGSALSRPGARALARSPHLANLTALWLASNQITGPDREALRRRFGAAAVDV